MIIPHSQEDYLAMLQNGYCEYVAVGYTKADKTIVAMQTSKSEIDVIDGKRYKLLTVMHAYLNCIH